MRLLVLATLPMALLLFLALVASLLGYGMLIIAGDVLPLAKLISKLTLILLLISIFPLKRYLQLSWLDFGFAPKAQFFKQFAQGLGLGVVTLLPVLVTLYGLDVHVWDETRSWSIGKVAEKVGLGLFFAMLIGLGEELLFRGLLLTSLRRKMPLVAAIAISSLYYAALHFLKSKSHIAFADISSSSGLRLMVEAFANWLNPEILSALVALFVVGVFLAAVRTQMPQSIGLCMGCHAGWVWLIKVSKDLFNVNPQSDYLFLVSDYDGVIGPFVSVWLALALLVFYAWPKSKADMGYGSVA